jgi:hypothetical protein
MFSETEKGKALNSENNCPLRALPSLLLRNLDPSTLTAGIKIL